MTDLDWFRAPVPEADGLLNACYHLLDRHVVRGRADEPALVGPTLTLTYAQLLEEVAAFAGALRAFGIRHGDAVVLDRLPDVEHLVAWLGCLRLGAVAWTGSDLHELVEESRAAAVVAARVPRAMVTAHQPGVLVGVEPAEGEWAVDWATVMRAGRTDPAACADVPAGAPAIVAAGVVTSTRDLLEELAAGAGHRVQPLLAGGTVRLGEGE